MTTCIEKINVGGWPELNPNTITQFNIGFNDPSVFYINSVTTQTAVFNFNFTPTSSVTNFVINVTAYKKSGSSYVDMGSASFSELFGAFSKEFSQGEYFLCVSSTKSFNGSVIGNFAGFAGEARFRSTLDVGETLSGNLVIERKPKFCDAPLWFDMLDGKLPPGITLSHLGKLLGVLPNLDCLEDAGEYSPAQNWYFEDNCGLANPWGREWRFKVRVRIDGDTGEDSLAEDIEWFCIRVYNNWSYDRDNFVAQAPFETVREIEFVTEQEKLPDVICEPCPVYIESNFAPSDLPSFCEGCDESDVVADIQLIEIPKELCSVPVDAMPVWWVQNKKTVFDCEAINIFIKALGDSTYFQMLLAQAGYKTKVVDDPKIAIHAQAFKNFLQLSALSLIDGRNADDIDYQMQQWKTHQNQKLPNTGIFWDSVSFTGTLNV